MCIIRVYIYITPTCIFQSGNLIELNKNDILNLNQSTQIILTDVNHGEY